MSHVLSPQKEPGKALELLKGLLGEKDRRVDNQRQAATKICECLEYLPLGIELVGGYLVRDPEMSLDMMFGRLQERKLAESALQDRETLNSTQLNSTGSQSRLCFNLGRTRPTGATTRKIVKFIFSCTDSLGFGYLGGDRWRGSRKSGRKTANLVRK
ncbi:MAG: hypothetical protein V7K14_18315 [Nostoc sp.]|uniref:hypothetical protein n=1 Tax=Nostoc sp. TaxID=1180 RepID=UPI002FF75D13